MRDPLDEIPQTERNVDNHDIVIWLGDLNYRLQEGIHDLESVKIMSDMRQFDKLLTLDQLRMSLRAKTSFLGFQESSISHPPTFKYDPGTDRFDSSKKKRFPAWCDRILWKEIKSNQISRKYLRNRGSIVLKLFLNKISRCTIF